jgi:hypothetical protein
MNTEQRFSIGQWLRSWMGLTVLGVLAATAVFFTITHTAHVLGILPYALLILCPLSHLFMHGGHGGHHHQGEK